MIRGGTVQRFHPDGKLKEKQTYHEEKSLGPPVEYDGKGRPKAAKPDALEPGEKKPGWRKKLGLGGGDGAVDLNRSRGRMIQEAIPLGSSGCAYN